MKYKKTSGFKIPEEFRNKLGEVPAFDALTPGRQTGYIFYFSAKQSKTRVSRIEKCMQQILDGKGIN